MTMNTKPELLIRDLGNGLILRRASVEDADALATMNSIMHSDDGPDKPNMRIGAWTRDLVARPHPTLTASDFTIVEETSTKRIVSTLCYIPQTWMYEGIEFGVGRPELVSTLPEFRKRGLVRIQMDEVHKWSEERGHPVQIITGIPYFYRQFGYDMALTLAGRRYGFEGNLPALKDGEVEPFIIHPADETDLDFMLRMYEQGQRRYAISCKRTLENIRYELNGQSSESMIRNDNAVILNTKGERIGYLMHTPDLWGGGCHAIQFEIAEGYSWLDVSPSVARYLWKKAGEFAERDGTPRTSFGFHLGESHPVYEALDDRLPAVRKPYAYYIRVPDLPAFLMHIKPALEKRLADSIAAGYTGELKVNFYHSGIRILLERGCIAGVEPMKTGPGISTDSSFPDLTFLHLVFGHRSFDELRHAFTDCYWENNAARVLLNALFPRRNTNVFPVF